MSVDVDVDKQARIEANLDLFARFMEMVFDDPSIVDDIPAQATLFLLPEDDPTLAAEIQRSADRLAQKGRPIYVRSIPPASPTKS
jgi:hypothetical protein